MYKKIIGDLRKITRTTNNSQFSNVYSFIENYNIVIIY